jgi:ATP-dependent DNA helicase RecQ
VLISSGADFVRWKMMLEQNGELTDGARTLMKHMERYAAGVGCRHRHLATYFGDTYPAAECGACDVCLGELEEVPEPVPVARKILSCVARVGQRFGVMHVTNVLRGQSGEPVLSRGHDRLSTFGLLRDEPVAAVRGYIEQLVGLGMLQLTDDAYPVLSMTPQGVALLKDEAAHQGLTLARQRTPARGARARGPGSKPSRGITWTAGSSTACARCASTWRAPAACRRMSSSTTPRCARWRACAPRRRRRSWA